MAEAALDHFKRYAQLSEYVAGRVAEAVEIETFEASSTQRRVVDTLTEVGCSNRTSFWRLQDQIAGIGPACSSKVGAQLVEDPIRDRDGLARGDGLPPTFDEAAFNFVKGGSYGESPPKEVDGANAQPENLALAKTEDSEKDRNAVVDGYRLYEPLDFGGGYQGSVYGEQLGQPHVPARGSIDEVCLDCPGEDGTEHAIVSPHRLRPKTTMHHGVDHSLDVRRLHLACG